MADVQRRSYHTPRFYQPTKTKKSAIYDTSWEVIYNHIAHKHHIIEAYVELGCAVFWINKDDIFMLKQLQSLGYETLSEMSAIDRIEDKGYFEMFYQLHAMLPNFRDKRRLRIKCRCKNIKK